MKIILSQDVPNLGEEGDVCVVKNGYARNFLIPTGAAVLYNKSNLAIVASRAEAIEKRKKEKRKDSASLKEKLEATTITLVVSAGESGKLFGSITSMMIQQELAKKGIEIEKRRIEIATRAIKNVGEYTVRIHLYEKEFSIVNLIIESETEVKRQEMEAKKQAKIEADAVAKKTAIEEKAKAAEKAKEAKEAKEVAKKAKEVAAAKAIADAEEKAKVVEETADLAPVEEETEVAKTEVEEAETSEAKTEDVE